MIHKLILSYVASAVIAPRTIVAFSDSANSSKVATANGPNARLVGTTGQIGVSAADYMVDVERAGVPQVRLGGTVAAGDYLTSDGTGRAVKVTAAGQRYIGTAEQPGVANDIIDYFAAPGVAQGSLNHMVDRPFVVDAVLTAIAVGYRNDANAYIADEAMPRSPVTAEKFKWTEYPIEEAFNVPDARVGRTGQVKQLEFGGTERASMVEDFGYDLPIPNSDITAASEARDRGVSSFDPEGHAVMMGTDTMLNQREVRVANIVHNPANYAVGRKRLLSGASQFNNPDADPVGVILAGMDSTLVKRPNQMQMGRDVWAQLRSHPKLVNSVKGANTKDGIITIDQFRELFAGEGIRKVLIGDTWYNTARPGQPVALARAWGKHIALTHIDPLATPELGGITWGLTAEYGGRLSGRIEDPDVGLQGGIRVRTGERIKELVVAQDVGFLIQEAVA